MSVFRCCAAVVVSIACSSPAAAADPWTLIEVLKAPAEAGYQPYEMLGFGQVVAMNDEWLAVGVRVGRCGPPGGAGPRGTVAMYRYDAETGSYDFRYQLCDTGEVTAMAFWDRWLVLGAASRDVIPGDDFTSGAVEFYALGADGEQWNLVQTAAVPDAELIGRSVAMAGGIAVSSNEYHNERRGRVLSWRLNAAGTQWVAETALLPPHGVLQPRILPDERFGEQVALDVTGCRAPTCTAPLDALLVQSRSGLHSYERVSDGWGSRTLVAPARGTTSGVPNLSMNAFVAVAGVFIAADEQQAPCGPAGQVRTAVRVLARVPGSAALQARSFACPSELGIPSMALGPVRTAVTGMKSEFVFSLPDLPAARIGTASTWNLFGNPLRAQPTDFVVDLDLTTEAWVASGLPHLNPVSVGDYFGAGLAVGKRRMAVGAPLREGFWGIPGDGYVAIYSR